jgi:hypothetical protein
MNLVEATDSLLMGQSIKGVRGEGPLLLPSRGVDAIPSRSGANQAVGRNFIGLRSGQVR